MGLAPNLSCNCYKVPNLADPILETPKISYLQDRYVLGGELGWGQFGVIRSCLDLVTGDTLACKSIAKDRLVSSDDLKSVKLEIEVMARLSGHPNVVDLKAVYEEEGFVHLVMELCAGGELFHRIEKCGRFSEGEARRLFGQLMEVVVYCHENGIVHRDLKPENILLATRSSSSPIKLADFGLATYIKQGQSLSGTVGSPFYIAPEVLAGGYNEAADVWSAGVILYILLSGMPPFWGKTKSRIFESVRSAELRFPSDPWDGVSDSAKELIARMLCRDPAQRLTAKHVLDHSWMKDFAVQPQTSHGPGSAVNLGCQQNTGSNSLSTLVSASRDVSFGLATPIYFHNQPEPSSPTFTCRSSFSSFYNDAVPSTPTVGFSFQNRCESDDMEVSPPIPLMPTFSFFNPSLSDEQEITLAFRTESSKANTSRTESSIVEFRMSLDTGHDMRERECKEGDFRRVVVAAASTASVGIRSKRNRTIGLGEQLDLMVTETVIRWSSCTHLPSTPSLQSSLVC